nr:hypothetical protein 3 [bacterium]
MPTIPLVDKRVETRPVSTQGFRSQIRAPQQNLPKIQYNPSASQGLQNLAGAVFNAAETYGQEQQKLALEAKRKADNNAVVAAKGKFSEFLTGLENTAYQETGENAFGVPDRYIEQFDNAAKEYLDGLANDEQKTTFQPFLQSQRAQAFTRFTSHERREIDAFEKQQASAATESFTRRAWENYDDPVHVTQNVEEAKAATRTWMEGRGMPRETIRNAMFSVENSARLGVLQRVLESNPQAALNSLKAGEYDKVLTPPQLLQMTGAAERAVKATQAHYTAKLKSSALDAIAYAEATGNAPDPEFAENLGRYAGEEYKKDFLTAILDAQETHAAVTSMGELSFADQKEMLLGEKMETESGPEDFRSNAARLQKMQKAMVTVNKERLDDPAQAAMKYAPFPIAGDDYDSLLAEQARWGLPEIYRSVVPKAAAKQQVAELKSSSDPTQIKQRVIAMREQYGTHYPKAMQDLQDAGLGAGYGMIAFMDPILDAQQMDVAAAVVNANPKELKKLAGNESYADIRDQTNLQLKPYFDSLARSGVVEPEALNEISSMVEKMAMQEMISGRFTDPEKAVENAVAPINGKYSLVPLDDGVFSDSEYIRVPVEYDAGAVVDGLEKERARVLQADEFFHPMVSPPGQPPEPGKMDYDTFRDLLESDARWVNLPDDSGMALVYNNATVSEMVDGVVQPVIRKFDILEDPLARNRDVFEKSFRPQPEALPEVALP